jgi:DNA-binding beta-propeller fold protein YncE
MNELNVTAIVGADTQITCTPTLKSTGEAPPWLLSATIVVNLYNPDTKEVIVTHTGGDILVTSTTITFTFTKDDIAGLADGFYPWKATFTTPGNLNYILNNDDVDQTIGNLNIKNYP